MSELLVPIAPDVWQLPADALKHELRAAVLAPVVSRAYGGRPQAQLA